MDGLLLGRVIFVVVLVILAGGVAWLLRLARCPGWAVVGGAVVGLALGPSFLGRVRLDLFERFHHGGTELRVERDRVLRRHGVDLLVAQKAQLERDGWDELAARHRAELTTLETNLAASRWRDQRPLRIETGLIVFLTLLGAGCLRSVIEPPRPSLIAVGSIGLWSAALSGTGAYITGVWLAGLAPPAALAVAAAVSIGPWVLTEADREAARAAELGGARLVETAGRFASIVAIAALVAAFGSAGDAGRVVCAWPLLGLPLGWILPRYRSARFVLEALLVPGVAACVGVRIDIFAQPALWPIVLLVLLSGDGRWLGALIGALLPGGRRGLRTMRLVLGAMATGPTQLAVTALALHVFSMPAPVAIGLLLGAILVEATAGSRRSMARRLVETEDIVNDVDTS